MKRLVIGILAHVDSGKTTLSEAVLYKAGELRRLGRVDHRDAFLDTNKIERERGITIFSKQAVLTLGDTQITLLDTPGHVDFSAETERTLQVLDYAVLVISGTDRVQSHTETLWKLLKRYNIPVFIFVNKMDLAGAEHDVIMRELKSRLDDRCVDFGAAEEDFLENAAVCDDTLMQKFIDEGSLSREDIAGAAAVRSIFPCYFGSALKTDGVDELLAGIEGYTEEPCRRTAFGAKVFKIAEDENGRRLTYMKITGGCLRVREVIGDTGEKVNEIRIYSGEKYKSVKEAEAGAVCAVTGLIKTCPGQGLGDEPDSHGLTLEPIFTYCVRLPEGADAHDALTKLKRLEEEETQLHIFWNEHLQEIRLQLMGEVQLEVLKAVIAERFGMEVEFERGSIIYKETVLNTVEGVGHYEPLRHYAEVHLLMEPAPRGTGLVFASDCSEDVLDRNWQRLIMTHLAEKTHIGVLTGSPVTDMKITLVSGRAHLKHTEGGDFRQATYRAVRQGLKQAQSILLEPWYDFTMEVPQNTVGRAMTDIQNMGGSFSPPETGSGDMSVISGSAPISAMHDYHRELTAYTRGRGRLLCAFGGYRECGSQDEVIARIGYDSDSDTENPADSVFCSHGAGFTVKWDKVHEHMHVDALNMNAEAEDKPQAARVYTKTQADDAELQSIFERTYGKIQRKTYRPMKNTVTTEKRRSAKPVPKGPEYLLVDGYNIIFAWEDLKKTASDSLENARRMLIDRLSNYRTMKRNEIILVFDAYKVKNNPGAVERVNNITVVYTKEAETADAYIERVTHEIGKKHRVRVATSDNLEQLIILGNGAYRISANEFLAEVEEAEEEIRTLIRQNNTQNKHTADFAIRQKGKN